MKKIMMIAAMMVAAVSANAQVWIGGEVGFNTTTNTVKVNGVSTDETTNNFTIAPEIGYNLDDNLAIGIAFGYAAGSTSAAWNLTDPNEDLKVFEVSPYVRYTLVKLGSVSIFADGGIDYAHIDNDGDKANAFGVGIKPGLAVTLTPKLSFVSHFGMLGYQQAKADHDGAEAISTIGLDLSNNLSFGLYYNF